MMEAHEYEMPLLLDERSPRPFRWVFGQFLRKSTELDTAIHRIRLSGVDLSDREVQGLVRMRVLVSDVNARILEEEAFGLLMDPEREANLTRILTFLQSGRLELRSAPLAGWSPDFSVFSSAEGPFGMTLGLHWFQRPFPHRGPAWAAVFGPSEAATARRRFEELWAGAYEIGPAIRRLLERAVGRWEVPPRPGK